ncbi:MAG: hypothetical protein DDT42_00773 [candidate division WS2 bacterium]|uniref:Uncharacterized protein n=1 Tax=Psychracetigena formicireducens TaxID=2986056 RepID=A0A9E2BG72_PSYF1|nr:hypothetical protein [Candidatus Psychracetigena formicireducens]MBT9144917.1 hypothetical protein [Candidatus Psychracetigena formicireducens]
MKRKISKVVSVLLTVTLLVLVLVIPASASGDVGVQADAQILASPEWYDFIIPGLGTVLAPGSRTILNGRAIDADHRHSGGKIVSFRVVRASDGAALGKWISLSPGQRVRLWNNATGLSVSTRIEASTPWRQIPVTVRAQGFWVFNF